MSRGELTPTDSRRGTLFVVFNPRAGKGDRDEVGPAVEAACGAAGRDFELVPVEHPERLRETAREAVRRAQKVDGIVVAAGGDGTVNGVAREVLGGGCRFGVLPRGTFNYFARAHGIPTDLNGALGVLLEEQARDVQVGRVNDRVFLVNASLGLYPQLLREREDWKEQLGRSRLVALVAGILTMLRGHRSLRLTIEHAGAVREVRTPTLFVGNNALQMEQLGLPEAEAIDRGKLAGVVLLPVGRWKLLTLIARAAFAQLGEAEQVVRFAFRRLKVDVRAWGARRILVATDGEVSPMSLPLTFEVAPHPLRLIRPRGLAPERREAGAARSESDPGTTPGADA